LRVPLPLAGEGAAKRRVRAADTSLFPPAIKLLAKRGRWRAVLQSWFLEDACQQIRDPPRQKNRRREREKLRPGMKIEQEEESERKKDAHDDGAD
jgi:hypothetical protein